MKATTVNNEILQEVKQLSPVEFTALIRKLSIELFNNLFSVNPDMDKANRIANKTIELIRKAKQIQLVELSQINNFEDRREDLAIIEANFVYESQKQHLFITKVNPIIIKIINTYHNLKSNIITFENNVNEENSYTKAVEKDEQLFIEILEDYVNIEIFLNNVSDDFIELSKEYLDNTLDTAIESYKQFKRDHRTYSIGFFNKITEDSLNSIN